MTKCSVIILKEEIMTTTTTNREFLRQFKTLKEKLISGSIEKIIVPQKNGVNLSISIERKESPFKSLVKKVKKKPLSNIVRPSEDIF